MKHLKLILIAACTVVWTFVLGVTVALALGYLHVANAQTYARQHAWKTFCGSSSYTCPTYPWATGYYTRSSNNKVRVEVAVDRRGYGRCYRVFAVVGDDYNMSITSDGSSAYWACQ